MGLCYLFMLVFCSLFALLVFMFGIEYTESDACYSFISTNRLSLQCG